jgi:hypothetical protein
VDRGIALLVASILAGSVMAFGGQVWWIHLFLAVASALLVIAMGVRACCAGSVCFLRSPLLVLSVLMMGVALVQLAPLPAGLAGGLSARRAVLLGPDEGNATGSRLSITADRSATVRWLGGAAVCLVLFGSVAHFVDRVGRLRLVCGVIVSAFGACTILGLLQMAGESKGAYGVWVPGRSPSYAPSLSAVLAGPGETRLIARETAEAGGVVWAIPQPIVVESMGPLVAGSGAYLALGALALPLTLGLFLHRVAPRGSRESIGARVRHEGGLAPLVMLGSVGLAGSALVGNLGSAWVVLAVAAGLGLTGVSSTPGTGHARMSLLALGLCLACLAAGYLWSPEGKDGARSDFSVWADAMRVIRLHPWMGVGMGSFSAVEPHVKLEDVASRTARSGLLQWWAEGGIAGLLVLVAGMIWVIARIPGSWRRVGSGDRSLPGALLGAGVGFGLFSVVQWSIQLIAVALCAAAVLGLANRWLAGGTDLFVEAA